MRRVLVVGLTGLLLLTAASMTGCGDKPEKAKVPETMMELPKQGPVPAGAPRGTGADPKKPSSSQ